jgi:PAS domain S-box-containing protein
MTRMFGRNDSLIVKKLTRMSVLASGTALVLACLALMIYDVVSLRSSTATALSTQAQIIGTNTVSALVFDDPETAERTLGALRASPRIEGAALYRPDGSSFALYRREPNLAPLVLPSLGPALAASTTFEDWRLHAVQPVTLDGKSVGILYIRSDLEEITSRLTQYGLILVVIVLLAMTASLLVSRIAHESISKPIIDLAALATHVSTKQDYSVRAPLNDLGELGVLHSAFNEMLSQIQQRDRSLMESHETEREATRHATELAAIVEASDDAIIGESLEGIIRTWNAGAERHYGYSAAEAVGQSLDLIVPADRREELAQMLSAVGNGETVRRLQTVWRTKGGRLVDVSLTVSPIRAASGEVIGASAVARDVTEQRQIEERFRLAVEASPSGMILVDAAGRIVLVNGEVERMFGYARGELINESIERLVPDRARRVHAELRDGFLSAAEGRRMGQGRDVRGRRKDGTEFPAEIGLNPFSTREGRLTLSVIVDISERQAMLERLEAQTAELQRSNDELMQFAYVASHDLQEPLRMVASYTELFSARFTGQIDERADKYIRYISEGATRMQRLVRDLLVFARVGRQTVPTLPVDMNAVCQRVLNDLKPLIDGSDAEVIVNHLPTVLSDDIQVGQVLQNLVANAIKFRGNAPPRIVVSAGRVREMARVSVEDNGIGIDMKFHDRVFEIFQRLHERGAYEGTGVGLAVVKRIVERHGGRVWFESIVGEGTRFHFTLPLAEAAAVAAAGADGG